VRLKEEKRHSYQLYTTGNYGGPFLGYVIGCPTIGCLRNGPFMQDRPRSSLESSLGCRAVFKKALEDGFKPSLNSVVVTDKEAVEACQRFANEDRLVESVQPVAVESALFSIFHTFNTFETVRHGCGSAQLWMRAPLAMNRIPFAEYILNLAQLVYPSRTSDQSEIRLQEDPLSSKAYVVIVDQIIVSSISHYITLIGTQ
jgi:hypothetical protein